MTNYMIEINDIITRLQPYQPKECFYELLKYKTVEQFLKIIKFDNTPTNFIYTQQIQFIEIRSIIGGNDIPSDLTPIEPIQSIKVSISSMQTYFFPFDGFSFNSQIKQYLQLELLRLIILLINKNFHTSIDINLIESKYADTIYLTNSDMIKLKFYNLVNT